MAPVSLFTPKDIQRFADEASATDPRLKLKITSDEAFFQATQDLRTAFDWAIQCDQIEQQQSSPRARQWHRRIAKRAKDLMEALDLIPSECMDTTTPQPPGYRIPGIAHFRHAIDYMAGLRPPLPREIDRLTRLAWQESEVGDDADDIDAAGKCQSRRRASFLLDRSPRTLALLVALAEYLADQEPRRRGERPDQLRRQLFMMLAAVHETIFGCRPRTRDTVGKPRLGSVKWARVLIEDACNKIDATGSAEGAKYVAALSAIAQQSDASLASLLEEGWRDYSCRSVRSGSTAL
jgi:hypothetical protein